MEAWENKKMKNDIAFLSSCNFPLEISRENIEFKLYE